MDQVLSRTGGASKSRRAAGTRWTPAFVAFLIYTLAIISYRFPVGAPAMAAAVLLTFFQKGRIRLPPPMAVLLALGVWFALGTLGSQYAPAVMLVLTNSWVKMLMVFFVALNTLRTRTQVRFYMMFLLFCFLAFPVRGAAVNWARGYAPGGRAIWNGEFANPNALGTLCLLQIGVAAALLVSERKQSFVWWCALGALAALPLMVLATASRSAFIGLVVLLLLAFTHSKRKFRAVAIGIIGLFLAVMVAPPKVWERVAGLKSLAHESTVGQADAEGSANERFQLWQTGTALAEKNLLFGVGLGAAPLAVRDYWREARPMDLHSIYLTVLVESGIPGLAMYLSCLGIILVRSVRVGNLIAAVNPVGSQVLRYFRHSLLAFLVASIWGSQPFLMFLFLYLALMWACTDAYAREFEAMRGMGFAGSARPDVQQAVRLEPGNAPA